MVKLVVVLGVVFFLAVEAAVAAAGSAGEAEGGGHELAAAVEDVAALRRRVVAQALVVPHRLLPVPRRGRPVVPLPPELHHRMPPGHAELDDEARARARKVQVQLS